MLDLERLEKKIERLYRLPLADFVAQRNALAAEAKKADAKEVAKRVRALAKPSVSAWVVNQLYWSSKKRFERLLAAGEAVREAQQAGSSGASPAELNEAMQDRRAAIAALASRGERLLKDAGQTTSRGMLRRIETTLDAIATYGDGGPDQTLGRLSADLDAPGFDALLLLAAAPARRSRKVSKKQTGARPGPRPVKTDDVRERAEARLRAAEAEAARRRAEADKAESEREAGAKRARQARHEADLSRKRYEQAKQRAERLRAEARKLGARARRAIAARERAERGVRAARESLDRGS
jgi:hypothetical protein